MAESQRVPVQDLVWGFPQGSACGTKTMKIRHLLGKPQFYKVPEVKFRDIPWFWGQNVAKIMDKGDLDDGFTPAVRSSFLQEPVKLYETTLKLSLRDFYHSMITKWLGLRWLRATFSPPSEDNWSQNQPSASQSKLGPM